jgi:hypothetical protein
VYDGLIWFGANMLFFFLSFPSFFSSGYMLVMQEIKSTLQFPFSFDSIHSTLNFFFNIFVIVNDLFIYINGYRFI